MLQNSLPSFQHAHLLLICTSYIYLLTKLLRDRISEHKFTLIFFNDTINTLCSCGTISIENHLNISFYILLTTQHTKILSVITPVKQTFVSFIQLRTYNMLLL